MIKTDIRIQKTINKKIMGNQIGRDLFNESKEEAVPFIQSNIQQVFENLRSIVHQYNLDFDRYTKKYLQEVGNEDMTNKILKSASVDKNESLTAKLPKGALSLNKKKYASSITELVKVMNKGHSLLNQIRRLLTGQEIKTIFIIEDEQGKMHRISEDKLTPQLVLSKYKAGTFTNPFSLAYQIDKDMLNIIQKEQEKQQAEDLELELEFWDKIWSNKLKYLTWKSSITDKKYTPFYNSKDAEIYAMFYQQKKIFLLDFDVKKYRSLRQSLGGGGGYASPFYKLGDIGLEQIKFFSLKKNKESQASFVRFSLLRDKMRKLEDIFLEQNMTTLKESVIKFFTEKELNISNELSKFANEEAVKYIEQLFSNVT